MMNNEIYYLAYGSNLNVAQMAYRCPQAVKVGSTILKGWELEFKTYLTIKPNPKKEVPLGVWKVNKRDERSLDIYEGYPTFYRKEFIEIELDGKKVQALVYIMNNVRGVQPPSSIYWNTCIQGYKDFGFNSKYLVEALGNSQN